MVSQFLTLQVIFKIAEVCHVKYQEVGCTLVQFTSTSILATKNMRRRRKEEESRGRKDTDLFGHLMSVTLDPWGLISWGKKGKEMGEEGGQGVFK